MITKKYLNPKNKDKYKPIHYPVTTTTPKYHSHAKGYIAERAKSLGITAAEWERRDKVVSDMAQSCPYKVGDTFYPMAEDWYKSHGKCIVEGKVISYLEIDKTDEWPKDDEPFIIAARSFEKGTKFICQPRFLSRELPEYSKYA
jgi:hypothetical protein